MLVLSWGQLEKGVFKKKKLKGHNHPVLDTHNVELFLKKTPERVQGDLLEGGERERNEKRVQRLV